jgi:hypothetical protein
MSEVDRPSLVFIDCNIPAFTSGRQRVEPTLDLSQNTSAKRYRFIPEVWGLSLMYKLHIVGDRTEPCGTLACMYFGVDISPSTETLNFLCERN